MGELSSNWKKLQLKLKTENPALSAPKRRHSEELEPPTKRVKTQEAGGKRSAARPAKSITTKRQMGGVHSTKIIPDTKHVPSPSLALWAEDNDISPEAIAEAYDLGTKNNSMMLASEHDKLNHGLTEGLEIGKYVAMDCEMVGVGPGGHENSLARVSLVDFHGKQIYDSFVKQKERVINWRTAVSGVSAKHMRFARDFEEVQLAVHNLLKDRILVGHDIKHDLQALKLSHPPRDIRDTSKHMAFRKFGHGRKPALKLVAQGVLGVEVQEGQHSSVEDARVTMLLFRKEKIGFDVDHANRYAPKLSNGTANHQKRGKPKKKRKP